MTSPEFASMRRGAARSCRRPPQQRMRYDAIVVGCGAAGVAALSRLAGAGKSVLGLEAASELGGRVRTVCMGGAVELGAEWIHGETNNAVFQLANRHRVPLTMDSVLFDVRRSDGTIADQELCDELMAYCWAVKDEVEVSDRPVGDVITEKFYEYIKDRDVARDADFCAQFLRLVSLVCDNYDATDDWRETSVRGSRQYREPAGHLHWSFGERGYSSLFPLLQGDAKLEVRVNAEVCEIIQEGDGVVVRCRDGAELRSHAVVVTVSLGVLKERYKSLFNPPLPPAKVAAIETISMGVMDKICLQYESAWWPKTRKFFGFLWRGRDLEGVAPWMGRILGFSTVTGAENVITLWTSGESAKEVELLPERAVLSGCKQLLQMFMGASVVVPDPVAMMRSTWYSNPYTRGSYSYRGRATDPHPRLCADLAAPVRDAAGRPLVLFAGEACSQHHYSTVHGAIDTGYAAADLIIEHAAKLRSKI